MSATQFFSQFFGIYLIVLGLAWLMRRELFLAAIEDLTENPGLSLFGSVFAFMMGLVIVLIHNKWEMSHALVITIFGYLTLLKGITGLLFPEFRKKVAKAMLQSNAINLFIFLWMILGGYLTYMGFAG